MEENPSLENAPLNPSNEVGAANVANLVGYIKRQLGWPKVRLELTDEQYIDALQKALRRFVSVAERPEKYYQFLTTAGKGVYLLPDDFVGMHETLYWIPDDIVNFIQNYTAYQMYVNFTGNLDISTYHEIMEHLQLKINQIGVVPTWEILPNPYRIKLYPIPQFSDRHVVFPYVAMPRIEEWTPQQDLIGYDWALDYATAICKKTLARIRGRYGSNVVVGDMSVTQDADVLLAEAKEELANLEIALQDQAYIMPIIIF